MSFELFEDSFQVPVHNRADTGTGSKKEICNIDFTLKLIVSNVYTILIQKFKSRNSLIYGINALCAIALFNCFSIS